ncbi:radical SAM protein [Streptomyces sp. NBC_01335]|uniref:radical SAM protein n=1 Tax=Streptomyces sp. NBC_01335 TaxID=2903828 RepID=UPI002E10DA24|nr:radical SAM protein [Streptomyces sp. NBC_01335]
MNPSSPRHSGPIDEALLVVPVEQATSSDGSTKTLWRLHDGNQVESLSFTLGGDGSTAVPDERIATPVRDSRGHVVCVSSQAGCNVACRFCATGLQPMRRDLTAEEMVAQVRRTRVLEERTTPTRVIFAGMGEPLLNLEEVLRAVSLLESDPGVAHISVSTMGVLPALDTLTEQAPSVDLFLSLHATTDEVRTRLIPLNRANPIAELLRAAERFARAHGRVIDVSYLLFNGVNDDDADADRLIGLLDPRYFRVQLLLWNDVPGLPFSRVEEDVVERFRDRLVAGGLPTYIMPSKARDIDGGCGQMLTEAAKEHRVNRANKAMLPLV